MTDLGLFNFIKNAITQGKSKEEINSILFKAGLNQTDINQIYTDIQNNNVPVINTTGENPTRMSRASTFSSSRPTLITVLCGYFFVSWILSLINWLVFIISLSQITDASITPSFSLSSLPNLLISLGILIAIFGYWNMKKWGVYLYIASQIALIIYLFINIHNPSGAAIVSIIIGLLLPITTIGTGLKYLEQMS